MMSVGAANRGDQARVPRRREPIVNGGPDFAALDRRIARTMVTGNQQHNALAAGDRLLEPAVDCSPRGVEREAVQIEHPIGLDRSRTKPAVPARIEAVSKRRRGSLTGLFATRYAANS